MQDLVDQHIGDAPVRYGQAPKRAMPFRLTGDRFDKLKVEWTAIEGSGDEGRPKNPCVEILSSKQQFVALGVHPVTRQPYRWERDPDLSIPRALLPPLGAATARRFMLVVADFIKDIGGTIKTEPRRPCKPETLRVDEMIRRRGWYPETPDCERIADALAKIGNADVDYDEWIRIGHAIKAALDEDGFRVWCRWSAKARKNNPRVTIEKWGTFRPERTGAGAIFKMLKELARISHTFFQNKREAADFLSFPYFGEKQCVCSARSAALHDPALRLAHAQTNYLAVRNAG